MTRGPGHAVGIGADVNVRGDGESFEIDGDDIIVGRAGYEGARAVWLHLDAGRAMADGNAFEFAACGDIEDNHICAAEHGNESVFAVGREFEAIGAANVCRERLQNFLLSDIDDGDVAILRAGNPELVTAGQDIEAFRAVADGDYRLIPIFARGT